MSKIKNISRAGWLVAGILAALLLIPTTAVAVTTVTMTIIRGGTASGEASVTGAHQLLTTTASPNQYVNTHSVTVANTTLTAVPVASPPSRHGLIVTIIHIDTYADPNPGPETFIDFFIESGTACSGKAVGTYDEFVNPPSPGETDIPFDPGLAVPAGDALCAVPTDGADAKISVTGYTVPSSAVPAMPLHRVPALPRQQR